MQDIPTLLLVEDEAILAAVECEMLCDAGYRVITAYDGESAVEIAGRNNGIDLILLDIDLGDGMDGTQAAQAILRHREIPILFLSSHTEPEIVNRTESITSYGYVVKNTGETVLLASIRMAFRLFNARTELQRTQMEIEAMNEELTTTIEELEATNEEFEAANEELIRSQRELMESEAALHRSEEWFRALYEKSPISIELYDSEGRLTGANRSYLDIFGVPDVSFILGFELFKNPNLPPEFRQRLLAGERVRYEQEYSFDLVRRMNAYPTSKTGTIVIDVQITPIHGASRGVRGYMVQIQDINAHRRSRKEIERSFVSDL